MANWLKGYRHQTRRRYACSPSQSSTAAAYRGSEARQDILFLIPSLKGGGAERVIATLLMHLNRERFRLSLAVVDTRDAVFLDQIPEHVEFIDLGCRRVRYALFKIVFLIWRRKPTVVFSTLGHLNLALAMVRPLLPRGIFFVARETSIVSCVLQTYKHPEVWKQLYNWFYKRHDLLICQSRYMQDDLVERFGYPRERSVVINNPLNVEMARKLAFSSISYTQSPNPGVRLVAAGRMSHEKGFDLLIEAIALLADHSIHLILLGEGPLLAELKELAASKGVADQVEFVGFQPNPYSWLAQADAFVLSSRYEGFPNVVLEALACGTPVIATPAPGGVREILDSISQCCVAEAVSVPALAKAISGWLATDRKPVPDSAIMPYMLRKIIDQYEIILGSPRVTGN